MKRQLVLTPEQGREIFMLLPQAFNSGEFVLCSQNPVNEGREKRIGTSGEIVRAGRAIRRILTAAGQEREFTDKELGQLTAQFEAQHKRVPTAEETAKWPKPLELRPDAELLFSEAEFERLQTYCYAAEWGPNADLVADLLDILDAAERIHE